MMFQEREFCLVPFACLCLPQVGHLLLPWPQMGPVCGLSIFILKLSPKSSYQGRSYHTKSSQNPGIANKGGYELTYAKILW